MNELRRYCVKSPEGRLLTWTLEHKEGGARSALTNHYRRPWAEYEARGYRVVSVLVTEDENELKATR